MNVRLALRTAGLVIVLLSLSARSADLPKVYPHPAGFSLRLPADWQANASDESVTLTPPGADAESYFLLAEPAPGLRQPNDPQVLAGLDESVKGLAPYLQRRTNGEPIATGVGQGVVLTWDGNNPNGQAVQFQVYAAIAADHLVQLTAVGPATVLAARRPTVIAIFGSLSTGATAPQPGAGAAAGGNPLGGAPNAGGNPLGRPAADPLVGKFADQTLTLELTGGQGKYSGTLVVNGQTYPVSAEAQGATVYGNFTAGGTQYIFSAKLAGDVLTVMSDGVTYQLQRQGGTPAPPAGGNPLGGTAPAPAPAGGGPYSGTYTATVQGGGVNRLQLTQQGDQVTGTLALAAGGSWKIEAQVAGNVLQGLASDAQGSLYFEAGLAGETLTMNFMEVDPQTRQPNRQAARAMPFQRQGGAAAPGGTQPPVQPQPQPQRPMGQPGAPLQGAPLQAGRVYNAGEAIVMEACGVGFTVPAGLRGQYPENGAGVVLADGQGRVVIVAGAAITPDAPTPQQMLQEFVVLLAQPALLGEGYQLGLAAQPQMQGSQVVVALQGNGPNGAISGHVIGVCSQGGTNEGLVIAFGAAGDPLVKTMAESVAGTFAFGAAKLDPAPWYQQLVGHRLVNNGGSHNRTSPNSTLSRDNQTTIQLGGDGRFAYQYTAMGMVSVPGGVGGQYETNDSMQGRFRMFTGVAGPMLLLLPEGDKKPESYSLAVDGNTLTLNGAPYSVN